MLTMLTTEEFAAWFRELPDAAAEEVATGLDLIELLGPEANPPASSEFLLWFESASGMPRVDAHLRRDFVPVLERVRHIMQHLESKELLARLSAVPVERAQRASNALQRLRGRLRPSLHLLHAGTHQLQELEQGYYSVLDALGLKEPAPRAASSALRELSLPRMRVLYGVDVPNQRALVVWGDHLDRNAYGPSVRRALALWQEFRDGAVLPQLQALVTTMRSEQ